mmetsp:Transcript_16163/g.41293  ORF Transcript_16163/g.41293 Transcript_16163/m.41293 type:complete len:778 (+) Transcript_16163:219-2552(+)|eukprot:jgi/Tetstr1/456577/TSEL_043295.t1
MATAWAQRYRAARPALLAAALFAALMLTCCGGASANPELKVPKVLWAQRRTLLYLRVVIPGLQRDSLSVTVNDTHVSVAGTSSEDGAAYGLTAHLFRKLEPAGSSWEVNDLGEVQLILQKFWEWRYWPRLLHTYNPKSAVQQNLQVDWKRWKPEFDDNTNDEDEDQMMPGEDSDWLDDEVALRKEASFVTEDFNREHMPLLNDSSFRPFLEMKDRPQQLSVVLFFERSYNKKSNANQQLLRLFAATSTVVNKKVQVGAVDAKASSKLMRKLRLTQFPTAKLFFPNGDMFEFNPAEVKSVKGFAMFLFRQLNPAWVDIDGVEMFRRVFEQAPRVVLGLFDEAEESPTERVADVVAKTYRAVPDPPPVVFSRLNASLLPAIYEASEEHTTVADILERISMRELLTEGWRGLVMVKEGQQPIKYAGPVKKDPMISWVYTKHFNALEEITRSNFNEFRRRNLPVMYILLDDDQEAQAQTLRDVMPLAQEFENRVSFVYTRVSDAGDLMDHLRCEYEGATFAVMEDFVEEYRYCADATPAKPLTVGRLRRLAEGVLANTVRPDKVTSQRIPAEKDNLGPVYDVVADNLIETVMDPTHDVVVHFYAEFDDKWDDDEFELAKLGEATEDVPQLKVTRMNGILNEKPPEFPEIGYIPCTWLFPMGSKHSPVYFNKTMGGFSAHRLLDWLKREASVTIDVPQLPNPFEMGNLAQPAATEAELPADGSGEAADPEAPTADAPKAKAGRDKAQSAKRPKSKEKAKLDDVMKELNEMRKEIKGGKKDEL